MCADQQLPTCGLFFSTTVVAIGGHLYTNCGGSLKAQSNCGSAAEMHQGITLSAKNNFPRI